MIVRVALAATLVLGLLAGPSIADAQPAGKVQRIGCLLGTSSTVSSRPVEAFRQGLRGLGWVEGQNIAIEYRFAEGRYDRLPDLAADLVRLKVNVIAAWGTAATTAAKNATRTIPIVMIGAGDPVGLGLIASIARPGGNVTGSTFSVGVETAGKGLELLREALPKVRRVAVLTNPANPAQPLALESVKAAARSLGMQLQLLEARGPDDFDGAFAAMAKERVGALLVVSEAMFNLHRVRLVDRAARNKLPSMHGFREDAEAGGLMSYGADLADLSRRSATYVDKILKGATAGGLPVEQPTKFELVINLKTAKALGLTIPASVLSRADQVIE
jgi:putative tryptophan/tyrosine transport system substrate-binding protein